ncbi:MAG: hypothetical protein KGN84_08730, partial [Acidobacteriota bacterium]|nr:hypothetical protein [Acidobacteriota bacterium]
ADEHEDSAQITKLLADAKSEATELSRDSSDLESFTKSKMSWESYASKAEMIKGHVNNAGKLLTQLTEAAPEGSAWQRTAIERIQPLLKELAANTDATINHLNENRAKVHFPEFRDYVKANYELSTQLETLIRDFVAYGEAKQKVDRLGRKLEVSE